MKSVTIIVPVYGDWESLEECIVSLKQHVGSYHTVMFVNDCGPDADFIEKNIRKMIRGKDNFRYYRNEKNLGFLKTCNRAVFELDKTRNDVILLNSDTRVTKGFIKGLQRVFEDNKKVGAVSPRTNNATIATIPIREIKNKSLRQEDSFAFYQRFKDRLPTYTISPVAHGFCILIRRSLIKEHGLFDEVFGAGYGEETDFCLRIAEYGYKSAISNRSYVYHLEARSFTLDRKKKLIEISAKIIDARYPNYMREVRDYTQSMIRLEDSISLPIFIRIGRRAYRYTRRKLGTIRRWLLPK